MAIVEDLIVSERGAFVGLHGKRLRVSVSGTRIVEAPLLHLRSVQIHTRSASLSAAALSACCEAGIPVHFVDSFDGREFTWHVARPGGATESPSTPTGGIGY